jgi:hypothetical protein
MGVQRHEFWEEVWILEGAIEDLSLGQEFTAGDVRLSSARHAARTLAVRGRMQDLRGPLLSPMAAV